MTSLKDIFNMPHREEPKTPVLVVHRISILQKEYSFTLLEVDSRSVWKVRMDDGTERLLQPSRPLESKLLKWAFGQGVDEPSKLINVRVYGRRVDIQRGTYFDWSFTQL